jgi:hypothetical protein
MFFPFSRILPTTLVGLQMKKQRNWPQCNAETTAAYKLLHGDV